MKINEIKLNTDFETIEEAAEICRDIFRQLVGFGINHVILTINGVEFAIEYSDTVNSIEPVITKYQKVLEENEAGLELKKAV